MKAEEKKELETNALSKWLMTTWENLKSGSGTTFFVFLGLIVALVLGYRFFANLSASNRSTLWYAIDTASTNEDLQKIITDNADSTQALIAQLYQARMMLGQDGIDALGTPDKEARGLAADNIEKARDLYATLAPKLSSFPSLQSEAYRAIAKAEESLIGIPNKDASADRGNIERVAEFYAKAGTILPEQEVSKEAAKKAESIRANMSQWTDFYKKLSTEVSTRKMPVAPPPSSGGNPGLPPGFPGLPPGLIPGGN